MDLDEKNHEWNEKAYLGGWCLWVYNLIELLDQVVKNLE